LVWQRALGGHSARVDDADFSGDGKLLVTSCADGTIWLWDVTHGTRVWTIPGHTGSANSVAFAPDGRRVASAGDDHLAKVWDVATGAQLATFSGHATGVRDLAFSPDSQTIASVAGTYRGPDPAEVRLWNSHTGNETDNLTGHTSLVNSVAYFPGGRRLATASDDRTIKIWDIATGEDVFTLRGHTSGVVSVAVSRDGRQIVSGSIDYSAKAWSTVTTNAHATQGLSMRRAAVEQVQSLFAKYLLKTDVLDALRAEKGLSLRIRAAAFEIAERRAENASGLYDGGLRAILRPGGQRDDYLLAVRRIEAACKVVADDAERVAQYRQALALALYRAGEPARAIETIGGIILPAPAADLNRVPLALAVTAMASQQLGDTTRARSTLDQLRTLVQTPKWAHDQEAQMLFREAEDLVAVPSSARITPPGK
jgi:hypothetical protein